MPKPQGTYLQQRRTDRIVANANDDQGRVATARKQQLADFYAALGRRSETEFFNWQRGFASLLDRASKGEVLSKNEAVRKHVAELVGNLREILEHVADRQSLEREIHAPLGPVFAAPSYAVEGSVLAAVIAGSKIVEGLLRLKRRLHSKAGR